MNKRYTKILMAVFSAGLFLMPGLANAKKKPPKPKFVGSLKCDGSCHDPWYQSWKDTGHGQAYSLLKAGVRPDRKKKAGLDPNMDYTENAQCLRCHTTGYKQRGGFKVKKHKNEDPKEPNFAAVGCEMCHSVLGGAGFRVVMKNEKEKFKAADVEKYGFRYDFENACHRCHEHKNTPFKPSLDPKYKFNFAERKKKVHNPEKFRNPDNKDQIVTMKDGASVHRTPPGASASNPYPIEDWEIVNGKLKRKGKWAKWDKKAKKIIWVDKG